MKTYNGLYKACHSVMIETHSHALTLDIAKHVKKFCAPWFYTVNDVIEHKSARKGDVLIRQISIYQEAYSHDCIIFKEALNCIIGSYNLRLNLNILITSRVAPIKDFI